MYFLDLLGTLAFAVTGAYRAKKANLALFGVIFLGTITAVGGGTVRDLIINRTPLFYLKDPNYLMVAVAASLAIFLVPTFFKEKFSFFRLMDSIGVASFAIIGVSVSYNHIFGQPSVASFFSCILLGMVTAFVGGVLRDAVMGDTPMAFKAGSNYALSAFLGSLSFYALMFFNASLAILFSLAITLFMREVVSNYGIYKKYFRKKLRKA